jgi:hypothetical protein
VNQALENYHSPRDSKRLGMGRRAYRDYLISSYSAAVESNYRRFIDQLQSSDRGSALGLDLLVLGLTGATALVGAADVDDLATLSALATGARGTVDKNLFFDRTLPAIIAAMDADRATIRADMARKRVLPIEQYSLDEAIDDLHRLQQAGRLDRAVARITRIAEADREVQQARLDRITAACDDISIEAAQLNYDFRQLIGTDPATQPAHLAAAASELGMGLPEGTIPTWAVVRDAFAAKLCDDDAKRAFIDNLRTRLEGAADDPEPREGDGEDGGN